jgi:glycerol-3-phosphate acyltransferase PlsY
MQVVIAAGLLLASYIFGSIPFGLLIVKLMTGKDIRTIASGRTGGTNVMRAAGLGAAILDVFKAAATVWLAKAVTSNEWIHALAPIAVILGHNYSIFLAERGPDGHLRLRGGAGGATSVGGTIGLWWPSVLIMLPIGILIWYSIGYASVTTMSVALMAVIIFAVRAALGLSPWEYVIYGVLAEILLVWALRTNIQRLKDGTERRHGLPAKLQQRKQAKGSQSDGES